MRKQKKTEDKGNRFAASTKQDTAAAPPSEDKDTGDEKTGNETAAQAKTPVEGSPAPARGGGDTAEIADSLRQLAEENEQLRDRLLRLQADFDNFRKRQQRERTETIKRANEDLILELLPVCDHLEMALAAAQKQQDPISEGIKLVFGQLRRVIEGGGLRAIEADGSEFDPNLHEAVAHIQSDDVPENRVIQQTRRGYLLDDKLLRPAQVVVSSGPPASDETAAPPNAEFPDEISETPAERKE